MLKSFKTEINPTEEQKIKIHKTIGTCRYIYNFYLFHNKERYDAGERFMSGKGEAYEFLMAYEESEKSADLRAVLGSIYRCKHSSDKELKRDIRCVGELTEEEVGKFLVLYKKSIDDLVQLFSGDQRMKEYLGL